MNEETHNRYFRDIDYNRDSNIVWATGAAGVESSSPSTPVPFAQAMQSVYERRLKEMISNCIHVDSPQQLQSQSGISFVTLPCI